MSIRKLNGIPLIVSFLAPAAALADVDFIAAANFASGPNTVALACADFNGDFTLDLLVANRGGSAAADDGTIVLQVNDGAGAFDVVAINVGRKIQRPGSVAIADIDGDGDVDAAVTLIGEDAALVLVNNGAGSFSVGATLSTGDAPNHVTFADLDGEKGPDIIVTNTEDDTVSVFLNQGGGVFGAEAVVNIQVQSQRTSPAATAAADFNGDEIPDIAVAMTDRDQVGIRLGVGNGTFQDTLTRVDVGTEATGDADPVAIVAADLDGDGDVDLVVANQSSDSVTVLLNNGSGTFTSAGDFPAGNKPVALVVADMDGDGLRDVVTASFEDDQFQVLLGVAVTLLSDPQGFSVDNGPSGVAVGQLNGDGTLDVAVACLEGETISVRLAGTAVNADDLVNAFADCGAACGPAGLTSLSLTLLSLAGMKRTLGARRAPRR